MAGKRAFRIGMGFLLLIGAFTACANPDRLVTQSATASALMAEVHLSPTCTCCTEYVAYLRRQGWTVEVVEEVDIGAFQTERGVPEPARGCHSTLVAGYIVEGHVPVAALERLLAERPAIDGIGLSGMPLGSPGMGGSASGSFAVVAFDEGAVTPYGEY